MCVSSLSSKLKGSQAIDTIYNALTTCALAKMDYASKNGCNNPLNSSGVSMNGL